MGRVPMSSDSFVCKYFWIMSAREIADIREMADIVKVSKLY